MRRLNIGERAGWREAAEREGFTFHYLDGEIYWDESACYAFTMEEIERELEEPTEQLHAMCLDLVDEAVRSEALMARLAIPEEQRDFVAETWRLRSPSLYGRFDFAYDGSGPARLLEYNADTPTSIYETGYFQWSWLEARIADGTFPAAADQFNSLHEKLIERFRAMFVPGSFLHFASDADHVEDRQTVRYLEDLASQAGLNPRFVAVDGIGLDADGRFVDQDRTIIAAIFKLYPWEDMFREPYAQGLMRSGALFIEPPWKAILSNKAILPLLWERHRGHPNLLPAFFDGDPAAGELGSAFVRKPFFSREGWDVELVEGDVREEGPKGGYGEEGHILQELAPLSRIDGNYAVLGSWVVGEAAAGLSVREDVSRITRNVSRFLPHVILD
ncbi:MAG TPA: glutathionylspermidine synthase family protein [Allosphingosinicella sp.]|jgi:glutathionylspermidine synthase